MDLRGVSTFAFYWLVAIFVFLVWCGLMVLMVVKDVEEIVPAFFLLMFLVMSVVGIGVYLMYIFWLEGRVGKR
jgi:hypothetical protein